MEMITPSLILTIAIAVLGAMTLASLVLSWSARRMRVTPLQSQPAQNQPATAPVQQIPRRSRFSLNMGIASTYQIANQLIGMQISGGNVLAQVVSACSIVAGTVTFAVQSVPGAWPFWIVAGCVGFGLAYLIENLTLSSLMKIRISSKQIKEAEAAFAKERDEQLAKVERPKVQADLKAYKTARKVYRLAIKDIEQEFRRKRNNAIRELSSNRLMSLLIATGGALASAASGGVFYHTVFAHLGLFSFALSVLLALVVTGTFVANELHKDMQEQAIREGFAGGNLFDAAMMEETKRLSTQIVHEGILNHLQGEEAQKELKGTSIALLRDIIRKLRPALEEQMIVAREQNNQQESHPAAAQNEAPSGNETPSGQEQPEIHPQQPRITRADLGMVEGVMYDKVTNSPEILERLQQIAQSTDLSGLTVYLKRQYANYANYITEERVARVMAAVQNIQKPDASSSIKSEASPGKDQEGRVQADGASPFIKQNAPVPLQSQRPHAQQPVESPITNTRHTPPPIPEQTASDDAWEYADVMKSYPKVVQVWLAKGVKSVSVEDIIEVTGHSRQKVVYHAKNTFARTPKNPEKYTVASILKWLKTTPAPAVKPEKGKDTEESQNGYQLPQDAQQLEELSIS
ncbi:MAG TPA: hypothetical protein VFB60_11505 [Ktedonobacteraceae bacterium]|nr:hypothetical protein [Ktedonobacteraceae bacterium]